MASNIKAQAKKIPGNPPIYDRGYNQAIFHALFVNMPAIITELFFILSPEEKFLRKEIAREFIARGIFLGVKKFYTTKL